MTLIIIDKQFFLMFDLLDGEDAKEGDEFAVACVVFIGQVLEQIFGEVLRFDADFTEDHVGLVIWRRMVDHVPEGVGVVESCVDSLALVLRTEAQATSFAGKVAEFQNLSSREVDMLRISMVLFSLVHCNAFVVIETSVDFARYQSQKLSSIDFVSILRQNEIGSSSSCDMLDLALANNGLETQIVSEFCQMPAPERLVAGAILFQIPDWKFIRIHQRSTSLTVICIDDHLPASTVSVQELEVVEQSLDVVVVRVLLLLWDGHVEDEFAEVVELL